MDEQRKRIAIALMQSAQAIVQGANPHIVIRSLGNVLREVGLGDAPAPRRGALVPVDAPAPTPAPADAPAAAQSAPKANPHREAVIRIFDHWRRVCDHPQAKLTPERGTKIQARLREGYTEQDLIAAVDGCAGSPFHRGENEGGTRYDDLTLIMRNGSTLERFRDLAPASGPTATVALPVASPEKVELDRKVQALEHEAKARLKAGDVEGYGNAIRSVRELRGGAAGGQGRGKVGGDAADRD